MLREEVLLCEEVETWGPEVEEREIGLVQEERWYARQQNESVSLVQVVLLTGVIVDDFMSNAEV